MVITSALHAEGPGFEPQRNHIFYSTIPLLQYWRLQFAWDDCVLYRNIHSFSDPISIIYTGSEILCKTVLFRRKILTVLRSGRLFKMLPFTQTYSSWLHTASANLRNCSVRKISWHNNHRVHGLGSTYLWYFSIIRRNLAFAHRNTKEVAYKNSVRPKLEYAAPIWRPYCKTQVEKVKRTAARWTCRRWRN